MKNLLCEVLNKCCYISQNSDADVFFEYSPHCGAYSVYYYIDGWLPASAHDMVTMECVTKISRKNVIATLAKLNALATELGVL